MTPDLNEPAEREAFEKMQIAGGCTANDLVRDPATNAYDLWDVSMEWNGWLARARIAAEQAAIAAQREAELVKNAERYRWLRAGKYPIDLARSILNDTPEGIDAAVDAARAALAQEAGR